MSKYKNKKTTRTVGTTIYKFDSLREAKRFDELVLLLKSKQISSLSTQPEFILSKSMKHNGETIRGVKYIADFKYTKDEKVIVEDVKGFKTKEYIVKKKWFLSLYGNKLIFKEI